MEAVNIVRSSPVESYADHLDNAEQIVQQLHLDKERLFDANSLSVQAVSADCDV